MATCSSSREAVRRRLPAAAVHSRTGRTAPSAGCFRFDRTALAAAGLLAGTAESAAVRSVGRTVVVAGFPGHTAESVVVGTVAGSSAGGFRHFVSAERLRRFRQCRRRQLGSSSTWGCSSWSGSSTCTEQKLQRTERREQEDWKKRIIERIGGEERLTCSFRSDC